MKVHPIVKRLKQKSAQLAHQGPHSTSYKKCTLTFCPFPKYSWLPMIDRLTVH
jgi:hypothetical protein